ncbi:MAG: hypothetical protein ACREJC_22450 [Tepidisphaeraceae bacterium]
MRRYEYRKIKRGMPRMPRREPGNDPASISVEPGVEVTDQAPTISLSSYTTDGSGGVRIISEEIV